MKALSPEAVKRLALAHGAKLNTASSGGVDLNALAQAVWEYATRTLTAGAGHTHPCGRARDERRNHHRQRHLGRPLAGGVMGAFSASAFAIAAFSVAAFSFDAVTPTAAPDLAYYSVAEDVRQAHMRQLKEEDELIFALIQQFVLET